MFQKTAWLTLAAAVCIAGGACQKKVDPAAVKQEREAKWRERQRTQAVKYYGDLVKNYPDSPFAAQAQEKLTSLQAAAPSKK